MSERVDVQQLRDRFIEKAHYGNGTGCRCCHLVDDGILTALLARLDALEEVAKAARGVIAYGTNGGDEWRRVAANLADALAGVPGEAAQNIPPVVTNNPAGETPVHPMSGCWGEQTDGLPHLTNCTPTDLKNIVFSGMSPIGDGYDEQRFAALEELARLALPAGADQGR